MKSFKSHKEVQAGKIIDIQSGRTVDFESFPGGSWLLTLAGTSDGDTPAETVEVSHEWRRKHAPMVGGYFVRYPDGYESFSPAKAFEEGYTVVEPSEPGVDGPRVENSIDDRNRQSARLEVGSEDYIHEVFTYHAPSELQRALYEQLREAARTFAATLTVCCPASADKTDAFRKLRECVMVANASIALKGRA